MNKIEIKRYFAISMALFIFFSVLVVFLEKLSNWKCTEENNFCEEELNKIWTQVEIIETEINNFWQ